MPLLISEKAVEEMKATTAKAIEKAKAVKEEIKKQKKYRPIRTQIGSAIGAGGFGFLEGRLGPDKSTVLGIPLPLAAGLAMHGVAMAFDDSLGEYAEHLHDLATGGVDLAVGTWARAAGVKSREKAEAKRRQQGAVTSGDGTVGRELSDVEYLRNRVRE